MPNPSRLGHFRIVLLLTPALLLSGCSDTAFHKNNKPTVILQVLQTLILSQIHTWVKSCNQMKS